MNVRQLTHTTVFHIKREGRRRSSPDVNSANSSSGDLLTVFLPSFFMQEKNLLYFYNSFQRYEDENSSMMLRDDSIRGFNPR